MFADIDFYSLTELLSDEEKIARESVRAYLDKHIRPLVKECWHLEKPLPFKDLAPTFGSLGLLGTFLPAEYNCTGSTYRMFGLMCEEIERIDSALRSFVAVANGLVMYPLYAFGSEIQKNTYLPALTKGEIVGCFGLTEPAAGSDPSNMKTTAKKDGSTWILNGSKIWISEADIADIVIVWARDVDDKKVKAFILERGIEGLLMNPIKEKGSMRAGGVGTVELTDCRVMEDLRLPEAIGLKTALMCLDKARFSISWGAIGAALDCFNTALIYSKERKQFGKPVAAFQLVQYKLAEMLAEITKGELICYRLSELMDKGIAKSEQISMAKRNNVRVARFCAKTAREILGANGISLDYSPIRHMANIETVYTYEGTDDIHTLILGRALTDFDAFK